MEVSKTINEYKYEINRIGNNINQLVKTIHEKQNGKLVYDIKINER